MPSLLAKDQTTTTALRPFTGFLKSIPFGRDGTRELAEWDPFGVP